MPQHFQVFFPHVTYAKEKKNKRLTPDIQTLQQLKRWSGGAGVDVLPVSGTETGSHYYSAPSHVPLSRNHPLCICNSVGISCIKRSVSKGSFCPRWQTLVARCFPANDCWPEAPPGGGGSRPRTIGAPPIPASRAPQGHVGVTLAGAPLIRSASGPSAHPQQPASQRTPPVSTRR